MRSVLLRSLIYCLLFAGVSYAETLEDAVRALARKIAPRLTPGVPVRVGYRNFSSISAAEASQARVWMERALRRRITKQTPVCDVTVTLSESLRETLVVAETACGTERDAAMVAFRPEIQPTVVRRTIERRLLWEQEEPLLDVVLADEKLIVLDTSKVAVYTSEGGRWTQRGSYMIEGPQPRDPRGRMELSGDALTIYLAGQTCRGSSAPELSLTCESANSPFTWDAEPVHFTAGRNTFEANGWPQFYSLARAGRQFILSEADGVVRIYDAERRPVGRADGWGTEFASVCGTKVVATQSADKDGADSVTLYGIADRKPVSESEASDFAGPVTAIWPSRGGATVIARNLSSGRYAAYSVIIDCNH